MTRKLTNVRHNDIKDLDFYPTPDYAIEDILKYEGIDKNLTYLEPCCGDRSYFENIRKI